MDTTDDKKVTAGIQQHVPRVNTVEETYTAEEFMQAAPKIFGKRYSPYLVLAAFRANHKDKATITEAQEMVKAFAMKEVK